MQVFWWDVQKCRVSQATHTVGWGMAGQAEGEGKTFSITHF